MDLLSKILEGENLRTAYNRVVSNNGAGGVDGMATSDLQGFLNEHWTELEQVISTGNYIPSPIRGKYIAKDNGGQRLLGIPTVIDRFVQQAIHQQLSELWEPEFSDSSYGFRPNRSAQQAVLKSQEYINEGYAFIIDLDLEKFFDKVDHDILIARLSRKIKDRNVLHLIRKFLQAPMLLDGNLIKRREGTPQGGNLSPILANVLLDDLDKELTHRGHRFVRYADDISIYVRSKRAARRVKERIIVFISKCLKLSVNESKSSISRPHKLELLGYGFVPSYKKGERGVWRLRISSKSYDKFKRTLKYLTRKTIPISTADRIIRLNQAIRGWLQYFKYGTGYQKLIAIDGWLRNRIRYCIWHHWKKPNKRMRSLIRLGKDPGQAYAWSRTSLGGWATACSPMLKTTITKSRLARKGLLSLVDYYLKVRIV